VNPFASASPQRQYLMAKREVEARVFAVHGEVGARVSAVQRGGSAAGEGGLYARRGRRGGRWALMAAP
jgi:hypothetical protein